MEDEPELEVEIWFATIKLSIENHESQLKILEVIVDALAKLEKRAVTTIDDLNLEIIKFKAAINDALK